MKPSIRHIHLAEIDSTNRYLCERAHEFRESVVVATAEYQTHGKGQGSNSWESEWGKNLLFSILIHPVTVPVNQQFLLSMMGALSLKDVLDGYLSNVTLKWPNDIYWNDNKLSGTLIETTVHGHGIQNCVFGVGLNVNQTLFQSDAPNPVSMSQILGCEIDRQTLLDQILEAFESYYDKMKKGLYDEVVAQYHAALYRRTGVHYFHDRHGLFQAAIDHVEKDGHLVLRRKDGTLTPFAFKEVEFILK